MPKYTKIKKLRLEQGYTLKEVVQKTEGLMTLALLSKYEKEEKLLWNAKYIIVKKLADIYNTSPLELFYEKEIEINMNNTKGLPFVETIETQKISKKKILENYLLEYFKNQTKEREELFIDNFQLKQLLKIDKYSKTYQTNGYIVYKIINPVIENINNTENFTLTKSTLTNKGITFYSKKKG